MNYSHAVHRENESEDGFTLIELMMVVLIIAILIAVMIPTFVGAKQRAQDRAMQSNMRTAFTAAKVVYSDHGDYTEATLAGLKATEPSLQYVAASSTSPGPNVVSVNSASATYIVMAGQSRSGTCFFLSDDESTTGVGVKYAKGPGATCSAGGAPAAGDPSWAATW
jgi:type IV pilus assembly protein PilA